MRASDPDRTVELPNGRTFYLRRRNAQAWEVFDDEGTNVGWFALKPASGRQGWEYVGQTVDRDHLPEGGINLIAQAWIDQHAGGQDPRPG